MSPKVPEAYLEARRTEILEAAIKCFMEKGFHNTTMQDIYKATSLSPGAVYNYFSSKEDIVVAAVKQFHDWSISPLESLISENPNESFIKIFGIWLDTVKQRDVSGEYSVQLDFYSEATRNKDIHEAMTKSMDTTGAKLAGPVKTNQRSGVFNPGLDPVSIAHVIVGMVFAAAIHKMLEPDFNLDSYGQVCEAMLTGTFTVPPEKRRKTKKPTPERRPDK